MVPLWIGIGFAAFGLLVGTTAGLSTAELTTTLLGLLFALIGGSIGALLGKLDAEERKLAGVGLLAFSIGAIGGLYSGIYVRINDLLRTEPAAVAAAVAPVKQAAAGSDYLKGGQLPLADFLRLQVVRGQMALPEACEVLKEQGGAKERN